MVLLVWESVLLTVLFNFLIFIEQFSSWSLIIVLTHHLGQVH